MTSTLPAATLVASTGNCIDVILRMAAAAEIGYVGMDKCSSRVGHLSALLARECGCDDATVASINIAARLRDIGKLAIPIGIILKPFRLTPSEREMLKSHTKIGGDLLANSNNMHIQMAEQVARYHHEWWDGTGYPGKRSGTDIPLPARITAVADVFDALTHARAYKPADKVNDALAKIELQRARQFDPTLADIFVSLVTGLNCEHENLDQFLESKFVSA